MDKTQNHVTNPMHTTKITCVAKIIKCRVVGLVNVSPSIESGNRITADIAN